MKQIIEQDICAKCVHLEPAKPLPNHGAWEIECGCAEDWPYTYVMPSANAITTCPSFVKRTEQRGGEG